jgi:hypothetical protein
MDTDDTPAPVKKEKSSEPAVRRVKCQYWNKCYRKDKGHKKLYIHPGDPDEKQAAKGKAPAKGGKANGKCMGLNIFINIFKPYLNAIMTLQKLRLSRL